MSKSPSVTPPDRVLTERLSSLLVAASELRVEVIRVAEAALQLHAKLVAAMDAELKACPRDHKHWPLDRAEYRSLRVKRWEHDIAERNLRGLLCELQKSPGKESEAQEKSADIGQKEGSH